MSVKVVTCQSADFHVRSRPKRAPAAISVTVRKEGSVHMYTLRAPFCGQEGFLDDQQSFFPCQARPDETHHPLLLPVPHGWRRPSSTAIQFR